MTFRGGNNEFIGGAFLAAAAAGGLPGGERRHGRGHRADAVLGRGGPPGMNEILSCHIKLRKGFGVTLTSLYKIGTKGIPKSTHHSINFLDSYFLIFLFRGFFLLI